MTEGKNTPETTTKESQGPLDGQTLQRLAKLNQLRETEKNFTKGIKIAQHTPPNKDPSDQGFIRSEDNVPIPTPGSGYDDFDPYTKKLVPDGDNSTHYIGDKRSVELNPKIIGEVEVSRMRALDFTTKYLEQCIEQIKNGQKIDIVNVGNLPSWINAKDPASMWKKLARLPISLSKRRLLNRIQRQIAKLESDGVTLIGHASEDSNIPPYSKTAQILNKIVQIASVTYDEGITTVDGDEVNFVTATAVTGDNVMHVAGGTQKNKAKEVAMAAALKALATDYNLRPGISPETRKETLMRNPMTTTIAVEGDGGVTQQEVRIIDLSKQTEKDSMEDSQEDPFAYLREAA